MTRFALLAALLFAFGLAATTASASTSVGWGTQDWPPIWQSWQRQIVVDGSDGVNHEIVVKPSGARELYGYPQRVDIYDYNDTLVPSTSGRPCNIISTHHAQCVTSGGPAIAGDPYSYQSFARITIETGDGNDSAQVSDPLNPIIVSLFTAGGDDNVDISGMWGYNDAYTGGALTLGTGNDTARIGPAAPPVVPIGNPGFLLFGGDGDDTIDMLNGSLDQVLCEDGSDTLVADPSDQNRYESGFGPPRGDDCEGRTPPGLPSP
jgi:hypothetical protein